MSSKNEMVRGTVLISTLLATSLLGALSLAQDSALKPEAKKVETSGKKYKNIKVLKNLPADQLIPVMRKFNAALGVKCDACHIINADHTGWEKDDKPMKDAARKMVLLVNDLNKHQKALDGKATCFMCHHGKPEPQTAPEPEGDHK